MYSIYSLCILFIPYVFYLFFFMYSIYSLCILFILYVFYLFFMYSIYSLCILFILYVFYLFFMYSMYFNVFYLVLMPILFILLFKDLLWNIQTKGQYPNWEKINAFMILRLWPMSIYRDILASACSFWLTYKHIIF